MSSSSPQNGNYELNRVVRVDVEKCKVFRLMFGERKTVKLRSDGLRSRCLKSIVVEKTNENGDETSDTGTGNTGSLSSSTSSPEGQQDGEGEADKAADEVEQPTNSVTEVVENVAHQSVASASSGGEEFQEYQMNDVVKPRSVTRWCQIRSKNAQAGNQHYHAPRKYHGSSTMVEHRKKWTYRMACDINAAEQDGNGQMYYVADPFLPMPRSRHGAPTAVRMNYAAQRLDNRKFRNQIATVKSIAEQESALCNRCGMRYFMPSINMQQRISYLPPVAEEDLPTVMFECPVCNSLSKAEVFS